MSRKRRRRRYPEGVFQAHIERLSHELRGIAHIDGKVTFIDGTLPGEQVTFQYTNSKSAFDEGIVESVDTPSPDRVTPKCPHAGMCGGCQLQHISTDVQIRTKQSFLIEQLTQAGVTLKNTEIAPPLHAADWGYRNKARLSVKHVPGKGKVLVGFREKNGRFVADCSRCEILNAAVGEKLEVFSKLIDTLSIRDKIPQIEVAVGDNATALVVRHLAPLTDADAHALSQFADTHEFWLYAQPGGTDTIQRVFPNSENAPLYYDIRSAECRLFFQPWHFTQINASVNAQMIEQAMDWLDLQSEDRVVDLFCGIGNFTLPLAKRVSSVVGVEGSDDAIQQASANATHNQITHAEFLVEDLFETNGAFMSAAQQFDKALLDPPRAGAEAVMPYFKQWDVKTLVYVSCNPATFVRDAATLQAEGYTLKRLCPMNMFPHTKHLEVMGQFVRHT